MPSLLDCQQLIILQIIFPLCNNTYEQIFRSFSAYLNKIGSHDVHVHIQSPKAVLLAGPRGSGKKLLVHIACNELGGLLLDLSPANLAKSFNTGI